MALSVRPDDYAYRARDAIITRIGLSPDPARSNKALMSFEQLGLSPFLVGALAKLSITTPTPVQLQAIPVVQAGSDTYINAETGSGKTLAYLLPLFSKIEVEKRAAQVLIIVPTHELAMQIHKVACDLAQHFGRDIRSASLIGGAAIDRQIEKLKKKPQIIVGTAGRILELLERGKLKLAEIKALVVDEADRLLVDNSLEMVQKLVRACPGRRQLIFVSATDQPLSSEAMDRLSPTLVRLHAVDVVVNPNIDHFYVVVDQRDKMDTVRKLIHATKTTKAIVFTHRNEAAEDLALRLEHHKVAVADLHSTHDKEVRKLAMQNFRSGKATVMIASDVAARGLDIAGVTHVINFDIPSKGKDYLHRVGRSGRAGAKGVAVSVVVAPEVRIIRKIGEEFGIRMREVVLREGQMVEGSGAE
jgi:superfamily II DNA/RNA helicase